MKVPLCTDDSEVQDLTSPKSVDPEGQLNIYIYLSYSYFLYEEMAERINKREDEYDVDFGDTSEFVLSRWEDILADTDDRINAADRRTIREPREWGTLRQELQNRHRDTTIPPQARRLTNQLQPLPRSLYDLSTFFAKSIKPLDARMEALWGLLWLNIKLSYESMEKLKRSVEWLIKLRRALEVFNRLLDGVATTDPSESRIANEARIAMIEVFDPIMAALSESLKWLRSNNTDLAAIASWPQVEIRLDTHLSDLTSTVHHLEEIANFSTVNRQRAVDNLRQRASILPDSESVVSSIFKLPRPKNPYFFGRETDIELIDKALNWRHKENNPLRTYTIYGKRGVGKTELALEYAHRNPAEFQVIFWIHCETGLALRQSFTDMAITLHLPNAALHGRHEENQLAVLDWLKKTPRRWLLIFDNAERAAVMKGYWPFGANGAILITSRSYYNFLNDDQRRGDTVSTFNDDQSFGLLCRLLGPDWRSLYEEGKVVKSEKDAAHEFLSRLDGLALAIQQAAILIKDPNIGGNTIESTFEYYKVRADRLPDRVAGPRSDTYHALDTLWDMVFELLSPNAKDFLGVLSLLTPDVTYIEMFFPRRQTASFPKSPKTGALLEKLAFCRQHANLIGENQETIATVVAPTAALQEVIKELRKRVLIKQEGRILTVHREVQEAMNYHSPQDLQECFDAAVSIVNESFPKRKHGASLFEQWTICSQYIHEGVHLALKFSEYTRPPILPRLKGTDQLVELIGNCAWYLYEISDYDNALLIIDIAVTACNDLEDLPYADLQNTAGACHYELNRLADGRMAYDECLKIRRTKLDPDDIELAAVYHNIGNLESAAGKAELALDYFRKVEEIRKKQGVAAENQLALLYLCMGRCYSSQGKYKEAMEMLQRSESLFVRTIGADKHFMAHVHYAYGNIEWRTSKFLQPNLLAARRSYNEALRIAISETPIHPITAAAYYSIGVVEFKLGRNDTARNALEKARAIAELRSPSRDDGTIARILWMLSHVLDANILTTNAAVALRDRAAKAKDACIAKGETTVESTYDADGNLREENEEEIYNSLVPGFFR